ncbi:hypothetical protein [Alteribacillus bidgolensis]|uniref:Uncharacterized protein n=1 Tax=Alteribacillus bidgolensis TaxID=930129 RepID=A0A1G8CVS4_9BACI|nr:hypothetical protein [Alteribacillus bidgolensis]SDH49578.1 hypothetical protein SAMN05216352_101463 [Alteribacillus bidgolensis]
MKRTENVPYSSPYLKEENKNESSADTNEEKTEEEKEQRPMNRDPWNDILFGRPPAPASSKEDETTEGDTEDGDDDKRPRFSWI